MADTAPVRIRPARAQDVPRIVQVVHAAYRGEGGWTTEAHLVAGYRIDEAGALELLEDRAVTLLVAERVNGGGLAGEGVGPVVGCALLHGDGPHAEFGLFAVDPAAQSGGIGRALLEEVARVARENGTRTLMLRVLEGRPELVAWYERCGFRATGATSPFPADPALLRVPGLRMREMLRPL